MRCIILDSFSTYKQSYENVSSDLPKIELDGSPLSKWTGLENLKSIRESGRPLKVFCDRPDHLNQSLLTRPERYVFFVEN
jgi:hypothetical protein